MVRVHDFERREIARIREHLVGALTLLREADTSHLVSEARARRASLTDELARYIRRGRFPRNTEVLDRRPALIDDFGTRCALAHLAERTGSASLIDRLSRTANHERVAVLRTHDELGAWLASVGLTAEEAARIQPSYTYYKHPSPLECACAEMSGPVARGTVVAAANGQCDVRIDKVLSEGDGSLRVGETVADSCPAAAPGMKMLISRARASTEWALRLDGGAPLRFETCKAHGERGAANYRGERPAPQLIPRRELDAVIGKTEAECREHFKLGPYDQGEHENVMLPRRPKAPGTAPPVPSGIIAPNAEKASAEEPAPVLPRESDAPKSADDVLVMTASEGKAFELTPVYYVGGGALVGAAVGLFVFGLRARKN
jgi:hypothetical protein